ncbi:MAG: DUF1840 family protein [Steroidobacteraceae bacterium]
MLVRFSSTQTEPIIMFGDIAVQLIKMLGASGKIPGAISAADIPAAIQRLQQQLQIQAASQSELSSRDNDEDEDEEQEREPPVALAMRAAPLIDLLERASAGNAPLMWEAA